jgi:hypothetical protein
MSVCIFEVCTLAPDLYRLPGYLIAHSEYARICRVLRQKSLLSPSSLLSLIAGLAISHVPAQIAAMQRASTQYQQVALLQGVLIKSFNSQLAALGARVPSVTQAAIRTLDAMRTEASQEFIRLGGARANTDEQQRQRADTDSPSVFVPSRGQGADAGLSEYSASPRSDMDAGEGLTRLGPNAVRLLQQGSRWL